MSDKTKLKLPPAPPCLSRGTMGELGRHEYCEDREDCQCSHLTWDEFLKKVPKNGPKRK